MPKFTYSARDNRDQLKLGTISASCEAKATDKLLSKNLFPSQLTLVPEPTKEARLNKTSQWLHFQRVSPKELMVYTRQLATLIQAGLPLLKGLHILQRQETNRALKQINQQIVASIEEGSTLADALSQHPRIFNSLYINMVKAGEMGGALDRILERIATYMEKAQHVRNKLKSALTYPLIILIASCCIMIFLMVAIIPQFELIFADLLHGKPLPALTQFIMKLSDRIAQYWPIVLFITVIIVGCRSLIHRTLRGRFILDYLNLKTPLLGPLSQQGILVRFARTLGTLMESGIPILQAIELSKETVGNEVIRQNVQQIYHHLKSGNPMASATEESAHFPPVFSGMVEVGEETGELPSMLLKIADLYEDELDHSIAALSSIVEPVLIILLALLVGTIVIALFLPIVSIIGHLN